MAKELPYYRVTCQEWQNGKISTMSDSCKGVFADICPYYWVKDCDVTFEMLSEKFKTKSKTIQKLIKSKVIKVQNGVVSISFLNEQLSELNKNKKFFSDMGKKGQKAKKSKAPLEPGLFDAESYKEKDKDKEKDNIIQVKFIEFWKIYPKRNGKKVGKQSALENFKKLPIKELDRVIRNAGHYGIDNDYAKDPERFLKKNFWQDWDEPPTKELTLEQKTEARFGKSE